MNIPMMDKNELREGDIIFIAIRSFLYRRVAKDTGSKASHVGIILKDENRNWIVAESAVPLSKYTTLEDFINRSEDGWYCIRRLKSNLSPQDIEVIKVECEKRMNMWYHLGFKFHSKRMFCSKFVFEVYDAALNIRIGKLETLQELYANMPNTSLLFWRLWYIGFIPWSRVTVTPTSQLKCANLDTIYQYSQ